MMDTFHDLIAAYLKVSFDYAEVIDIREVRWIKEQLLEVKFYTDNAQIFSETVVVYLDDLLGFMWSKIKT